MSLRERIKRRFTKNASDTSDGYPPRRKDIEYYKPNEIPKSKYRGKVDKVHQAQLDAYSLEGAFNKVRRRASQALSGTFSPGGTNAQSAAVSAANSRRPSYSYTPAHRSHLSTAANSISEETTQRSASPAGSDKTTGRNSTGITNKNHSHDSSPSLATDDTESPASDEISRAITAADSRADTLPNLTLQKTITSGFGGGHASEELQQQLQYEHHFSAEELEKAMTRAALRPRRGTVVAPIVIQPESLAA